MNFWRENVDKMLEFYDQGILKHPGSVSNKQMESKVRKIYEEFDSRRKQYEALKADQDDIEELKQLEERLKKKKK
jgi:hypothetical protein